MPYTALISMVIGAINIVPVFGSFIGAIPGAFLLLLTILYGIVILLVINGIFGSGYRNMMFGLKQLCRR